jgi:hypothetical protein
MQARYQATLQPEQKEGQKAPCPRPTQELFPRTLDGRCGRDAPVAIDASETAPNHDGIGLPADAETLN